MAVACPLCGTENRDKSSFCASCGTPLTGSLNCPMCGSANAPTARFCQDCAAPLLDSASGPGALTGLLRPQNALVDRYVIVRNLGQGGMGAVYKATDSRLGRKTVAIKEMTDAAITDPLERQQARRAFSQEAQMLAGLDHPNLPRVTDHFSIGVRQYLVMDFVEGQTLLEVVLQTPDPLGEERVVGWAEQLCNALEYLHSQEPPVVFRDLKPSNVMVDTRDRVKLIDFGIARLFKPGKQSDTVAFGTAGYAPPEQYGQGQTDARSDLFSLGATMHHLLTGRDPGVTPFQFPTVRELNPAVSEAVERVVMRAVEQDPAERWQDSAEMRTALTESTAVSPQVKSQDATGADEVIREPVRQPPDEPAVDKGRERESTSTSGISEAHDTEKPQSPQPPEPPTTGKGEPPQSPVAKEAEEKAESLRTVPQPGPGDRALGAVGNMVAGQRDDQAETWLGDGCRRCAVISIVLIFLIIAYLTVIFMAL